jgi:hypothetical protein
MNTGQTGTVRPVFNRQPIRLTVRQKNLKKRVNLLLYYVKCMNGNLYFYRYTNFVVANKIV